MKGILDMFVSEKGSGLAEDSNNCVDSCKSDGICYTCDSKCDSCEDGWDCQKCHCFS